MPEIDVDGGVGATSESEEMYLITIAMAVEDGQQAPIPVPQLADALAVSRVSANEMVKKLDARGLIEYVPYKGAVLRPEGELIAKRILRRRRLWSVFLAEQLGLTPQAADAVACEFEHVTPADVAQRLSEFLAPEVREGLDLGDDTPNAIQALRYAYWVDSENDVVKDRLRGLGIVPGPTIADEPPKPELID